MAYVTDLLNPYEQYRHPEVFGKNIAFCLHSRAECFLYEIL